MPLRQGPVQQRGDVDKDRSYYYTRSKSVLDSVEFEIFFVVFLEGWKGRNDEFKDGGKSNRGGSGSERIEAAEGGRMVAVLLVVNEFVTCLL